MPAGLIAAITCAILMFICLFILLVCRSVASDEKKSPQKYHDDDITAAQVLPWAWGITVLFIASTFLFTFFSSINVVSTKNVGIETRFGQPVGYLNNGFHWIDPRDSVTEMDAAIQTDYHTEGQKPGCIPTRIANQVVACTDVIISWRIKDGSADSLFQNYRDFDNVRNSLVDRNLGAAMNDVAADYDPLAMDAPSLKILSDRVFKEMQNADSNLINVTKITIRIMHFDPATQNRINQFNAQIGQTRIAQQQILTAQAQATANAALASSVNTSANVLVSRCIDYLNELAAKNMTPPAGFSCWPGNGSGIVIPAVSR